MNEQLNNVLAKAIKSMALLNGKEAKEDLKKEALQHSLQEWKAISNAKVAGVGGLTGLLGGPIGLALEAGDIAYLFAASGRACYGVGHISGAEIDYENDIPLILAIWSGAAEATGFVATGKVGIKAGGYIVKAGGKILGKFGTKVVAGATLSMAGKSGGKVAGKIISKTFFKGSTKAASKIVTKVGAKVGAKVATKAGFKWLPLIGGVVSAGINYWVASGLMDAAQQYYNNEYIVFDDELAKEFG
jgi:hypothetical protein